MVKNPPANADARDAGLIPGSGRSLGGGNGNSLQYSCLKTPMVRGVWRLQSMVNVSKNDSKVTLIIRSLSFIIISSWRGRARSEGRLWGLIANNLWPLVSILQTILRNHK